MSNCGSVYVITNAVNGKIYVGKTNGTLKRRWKSHLDCVNAGVKRPLYSAIRKYGVSEFSIKVLVRAGFHKLPDLEREWIMCLNSRAPNGYNLTEGGDGLVGFSPSKETREKMSLSAKRRPKRKGQSFSKKTRQKISASVKKYWKAISPEAREQWLEKHRNYEATAETRKKLSAINKGRVCSDATRRKISAAHSTPEMRARKSAWSKGHTLSPEARNRIRVSMLGNQRGRKQWKSTFKTPLFVSN